MSAPDVVTAANAAAYIEKLWRREFVYDPDLAAIWASNRVVGPPVHEYCGCLPIALPPGDYEVRFYEAGGGLA